MAQDLIKNTLSLAFKAYIAIVTFWIAAAFIASYFWYVDDGGIYAFCIHVNKTQFHYFSANSESGCLIDWWPFLREALFLPLMVYMLLILPAMLILLYLRRHPARESRRDLHNGDEHANEIDQRNINTRSSLMNAIREDLRRKN